jgi:hypothetical protein
VHQQNAQRTLASLRVGYARRHVNIDDNWLLLTCLTFGRGMPKLVERRLQFLLAFAKTKVTVEHNEMIDWVVV